ncbi:hypothetical protein [Micromonospora tulbaghiae]|uniref:hypothetical protein n=1 Tax=Micromonospora tulbaghiae TaxID=479978 RepID=UPI0036ACE323
MSATRVMPISRNGAPEATSIRCTSVSSSARAILLRSTAPTLAEREPAGERISRTALRVSGGDQRRRCPGRLAV